MPSGKTPRVTLLHYTAPPVVGGVENVLAQHARLLRENGYAVQIVAGTSGDDGADPDVVCVPELDSKFPENQRVAQALAEGTVPPAFEALTRKIADELERLTADSDIVIAHNVFNYHFNLPLTAALHRLSEGNRIPPLVAWCHDISRYVNPASGAPQRFGAPWDLLRTFCPQVRYVAVSPQRRDALAKVLGCSPAEIEVVPNGVDAALVLGLSEVGARLTEDLGLDVADFVLLMPVRITLAKNIEFAIEVASALKQRGTRVKLVITGPPDPHSTEIQSYFRELEVMRERLDLTREVYFLYNGSARVPGPLLMSSALAAEFYRVCDVVMMPSHREGFGLPVLEAGMADKPVFCTDLPVLDLVSREEVALIRRDESPEEVAVRLETWANHDRAYQLRRRVRQEFTWAAVFAHSIRPLLERYAPQTKEVV